MKQIATRWQYFVLRLLVDEVGELILISSHKSAQYFGVRNKSKLYSNLQPNPSKSIRGVGISCLALFFGYIKFYSFEWLVFHRFLKKTLCRQSEKGDSFLLLKFNLLCTIVTARSKITTLSLLFQRFSARFPPALPHRARFLLCTQRINEAL